jgi:ribonuclease HI
VKTLRALSANNWNYRNVSEPLPGLRQTNQRAELTALKRALTITPLNRNVLIFSDSHYSIQCLTTWFQKWRINGYQTAARKPVENKDLVEECLKLIEERHVCGVKTEFRWVKGHGTDEGNEAADRLAVRGAEEARRIVAGGGAGAAEMAIAGEEFGLGIGGMDSVLGFGEDVDL